MAEALPERAVVVAVQEPHQVPAWWRLDLECGHTEIRPFAARNSLVGGEPGPAPTVTRCRQCRPE